MEKELKIRTPDKHIIYGTFRPAKRKSSTLIIFVHGLGGHKDEHIFYNGARYLGDRGINTFRFDLYTGEKGGRTLTKSGISTHAKDLDTVVKYFRKKFKKIFVVGHSLGALVIQKSNTGLVDGVIFWDGARSLKNVKGAGFKYVKALDLYLIQWGPEILMGKRMNKERNNFPLPLKTMPKIKQPIKIIVAGKGTMLENSKIYLKYANKPKAFAVIKGATHNFNEEGTAEKLFEETYSFIKKFT